MISSASPPIEEAGLTPTDGRCGAFDRRAGTGSSERNVSDIHCCGDIEAGTSREEGQNGKVRGLGIGFFVGMGRLAGNQGDSGHSGAEAINKESEAAARRP